MPRYLYLLISEILGHIPKVLVKVLQQRSPGGWKAGKPASHSPCSSHTQILPYSKYILIPNGSVSCPQCLSVSCCGGAGLCEGSLSPGKRRGRSLRSQAISALREQHKSQVATCIPSVLWITAQCLQAGQRSLSERLLFSKYHTARSLIYLYK